MGDNNASHLEKMGRELKCPICLSLLESAMSLTCNHVFCNLCIHKSMKSGANCPVCKVPFQRREIRPAPHMDNLVNIYKSMEVSSGVKLFVTQNQSTPDIQAAQVQADEDSYSGKRVIEAETLQITQHQERTPKSSRRSVAKAKKSGSDRGKSSFSMNKRVQMPESPSTETPLREAISELGNSKIINNILSKSSPSPNENPFPNEKESPRLSPFFWLQDDVERSSQQTDTCHLTCTPVKAPFSDLMVSDDAASDLSPKEQSRHCSKAELFDSEMFEWTQRAGSPELCSSAIDMQDMDMYGQMPEHESKGPSNDASINRELITERLDDVNLRYKDNYNDDELQANPCLEHKKSGDSQNECNLPQKRGREGSKNSQNKYLKKDLSKVQESQDVQKTADNSDQGLECKSSFAHGSSKPEGSCKFRSIGSLDGKLFDKVDDQSVSKMPTYSRSERGTTKGKAVRTADRNPKSSEPAKRNKQKHKVTKPSIIREATAFPDKRLESDDLPQKRMTDENEDVCMEAVEEAQGNKLQNNLMKARKDHSQMCMPTLRKCNTSSIKCAFCHSAEETEASGGMVHYSNGKPVPATHSGGSVIHSHKNCTEWAPNVYFEDDIAVNLEEELARSRRIKCSLCGVKGAALGCFEKSCRKSFHVPCAKMLRQCRWDTDHFVILCPLHVSAQLPCEMCPSQISQVKKRNCHRNGKLIGQQPQDFIRHDTNPVKWNCGRQSEKISVCCSALTTDEKEIVCQFAKSSGVAVFHLWDPRVTHVIASTNANGACKRTRKVLMGILEGKWILSIKWIHACLKATRLVEETSYEISCDTHGVKNGPLLGRLRLLNKQPKLFTGIKFYFAGHFDSSYKGDLQDLITAAGGTILHRKPVAENFGISTPCSLSSQTVIIYSVEQPDNSHFSRKDMLLNKRQSDAEALARSSGAKVANNTWLVDCIAGHRLQDL